MTDSGFLSEETNFESVERIGAHGATSEAFIAKIKGKTYFMKRLRAELAGNPKYVTLFEKEYEIGKSLVSPYIPQYLGINRENGNMYILIEYVLGENIEEKLQNDPLWFHSEKNIQKMLLQLLEGLEELHRKDILYLDINLKNIMLTKFGGNVKITDLGFCANAAYHHTAGCTIGFQAPEVEEKRWEKIDAQSDIYSVGMLLQYIKERSGAKFPRRINSFMQRCMSKEKRMRFSNAGEAMLALKEHNRWGATIGVMTAVVVAIVTMTLLFSNGKSVAGQQTRATMNGVEYKILSHEDLTCTVTGGEGKEGNIYIEPEMKIGGKVYRTVAIEDSAFNRSTILSVYLPEGLEVVGKGAFNCCHSIVTLNLPGTITDFTGAFVRMSNLHRIKIPAIKDVSATAFVDAVKLADIHFPEGVERICRDAFVSCKALRRISLPQTLKVIERGVFYNCETLEEITISAGVQEIGDYAFYECDNLQRVYCHATVPPRITAIFNNPSVVVYVQAEALEAYMKDYYWSGYHIRPMQPEMENED